MAKTKAAQKLLIRKVSLDDIDKLLELEKLCFSTEAYSKEEYIELLSAKTTLGFKVVINDHLAGFILGNRKTGVIYTLNVHPSLRRRGVGTLLVRTLIKELKKSGCHKVVLQVRTDNTPAINLYKKLGFSITSIKRNYYGPNMDAFQMVKLL